MIKLSEEPTPYVPWWAGIQWQCPECSTLWELEPDDGDVNDWRESLECSCGVCGHVFEFSRKLHETILKLNGDPRCRGREKELFERLAPTFIEKVGTYLCLTYKYNPYSIEPFIKRYATKGDKQ